MRYDKYFYASEFVLMRRC